MRACVRAAHLPLSLSRHASPPLLPAVKDAAAWFKSVGWADQVRLHPLRAPFEHAAPSPAPPAPAPQRKWSEFVSNIVLPKSWAEIEERLVSNGLYYRTNYLLISLVIFLYSMCVAAAAPSFFSSHPVPLRVRADASGAGG